MIQKYFFLMIFSAIILCGCEQEFIPDINNNDPQIVVEAYVEAGEGASPPFAILTKTIPFFSSIDSSVLNDIFVHDAIVRISDGTQTATLSELCFNDLTEVQQQLAAEFLGIGELGNIGVDICVYLELSTDPLMGRQGVSYSLEVEAENSTLRATTSIPIHVPLDSVKYQPVPDPENDSLVEIRGFIRDPANQVDFYRYFTRQNSDPLYSGLTSVIDDKFFNGDSFEFPLQRGQLPTQEIDFNTFGYFWRGDTVQVKWTTIDEAHFDFWSTLEFNTQSDGPFTSFTRINSNIEGGLGIFGGYGVSFYTLIVPK